VHKKRSRHRDIQNLAQFVLSWVLFVGALAFTCWLWPRTSGQHFDLILLMAFATLPVWLANG
jgi:hypothetical protein